MDNVSLLTDKEQAGIIFTALKDNYRETMERKRVPSDYLLTFTEGGESFAVADAIAKAQRNKTAKEILQFVIDYQTIHTDEFVSKYGFTIHNFLDYAKGLPAFLSEYFGITNSSK